MVIHDFVCLKCDTMLRNMPSTLEHTDHEGCGGELVILWNTSFTRPAAFHLSESTALYWSEKEKKFQYPMRNDAAVPDRLRQRGYEKVYLRSDHEVGQFEKKHNVINERRHYDGNGRGFDM